MANSPKVPREQAPRRWLFGSAVLDEYTLELTLNGAKVPVERKPLEVLLFLLHHAGEVVTRDELLEGVWPGRVTTEQVLTQCIRKAREALADADQSFIKTVYGYGYRFAAPVQVEFGPVAQPAHFEFKAGDHPPLRPLWSLVQRLGSGGHGEAWLARHDKTREERVYKFALDAAALTSLKREITLFRVLNDALGNKAPVVRILDWNLVQPPCFIESEYIAAGSLVDWAEKAGGVANIPMFTRLDLAAQVADALAAAHSTGVLHKDLKPSNVLIDIQGDGTPTIKLCDFGSGGVLNRGRLDQITRLGFTKTIDTPSSNTPMYAAPEVMAGQPHTTRSDVYALGVLLYQLVIGDLKRAPAPGWERGVTNELLREDIGAACEGDHNFRVIEAAELARCIRSLELRRHTREAEKPETFFATVGTTSERVAYQVLGRGERDILVTTGSWGYMEAQCADAISASFFRRLASFSRVIRFDPRGWGLSDPPSDPDTPLAERWIQDLTTVLNTVGSARPIIVANGDGGPLAIQFVHRYPERCSGLVLSNTTACFVAKPDYPQGLPAEVTRAGADSMLQAWGRPESVARIVPSRAHDKAFVAWLAREQRMAGRQRAVSESLDFLREVDVRSLLPTLRVPTLVMARDNLIALPPEQTRYLVEHVPGARFVPLRGSDSPMFWETPDTILDAIEEFVTGLDRDNPR